MDYVHGYCESSQALILPRDVLERGAVRFEYVSYLEPALPCGSKPRDVPHAFAVSACARRARAGGVGEVEIEAEGAEVRERGQGLCYMFLRGQSGSVGSNPATNVYGW